jgi:hypothetical protein
LWYDAARLKLTKLLFIALHDVRRSLKKVKHTLEDHEPLHSSDSVN